VASSGRNYLEGIEAAWASGSEPEIVLWLKQAGKLGSGIDTFTSATSPASMNGTSTSTEHMNDFPSFPDTPFALTPDALQTPSLDYESLTLMRLRQMEREKLASEIRKAEA